MIPEFPTVISSSSRTQFSKCPQLFYLETILGLRLKGGNVHLDAGHAYARALEVFREYYYASEPEIECPDRRLLEGQALGLEALITDYGHQDPPEHQYNKSFDRVVKAFIEYFIKYPPATDRMQPARGADNKPMVEFSFVFDIPGVYHPVTGDPLLYSGRADMVCEYNNAIWVYDDKTTGQMGATWRNQWELRSQFTGYIYGAIQHGMSPAGAIVRGMCLLKRDFKTEEVIVTRTPSQIERWLERLVWDAERMVQCWKDGYWPHVGEESSACVEYSGCAMKTLCTSANPAAYVPVYYQEYRWDPVEGKQSTFTK